MIHAEALCVGYRRRLVLRALSLSAPRGQITVLLGANGSGKSTLLKALAGILPSRAGVILLDGQPLADFTPRELAARTAYMPQTRPTTSLTVEQLLCCARFPHVGLSRPLTAEDRHAVASAAERCRVTPFLHRRVDTLSGGEQQRVYLAMALAQGAPLLLLDEPTAHMDIAAAFETAALLRSLREEGHTILLAMHDLPLALSLADRVVILDHGTDTFAGTPADAVASGAVSRAFGVQVSSCESGYILSPQ